MKLVTYFDDSEVKIDRMTVGKSVHITATFGHEEEPITLIVLRETNAGYHKFELEIPPNSPVVKVVRLVGQEEVAE